ncbi:MAG: xylulokinase [Salinibacter sp.]
MPSSHILAHDLGTTGDKATLYASDGTLVDSCFSPYETDYPEVNWVEQRPSDWWAAVCQATQALIHTTGLNPDEIGVVSFSGQMLGCLPVDEDGQPLRNAIIWADHRAVDEAQQLADVVGLETFYRITGHRASASYSAPKLMWVRDNEPRVFEKTHRMLQAKDYIVHRLTGQFATDHTDASSTNVYDLNKRDWSDTLLDATGLPKDVLPPIYASTDVVGEVTADAADQSGLAPGTRVVIGGGDGLCAAAGAGSVREGIGYSYLGSSGWIAMSAQNPLFDPDMRTFTWAHLDPELVSPNGTMQSAGGALQWARDAFCQSEVQAAEQVGLDSYQLIDQHVENCPAGARGLIFLPYLLGERSPRWHPDARGAFVGLARHHTKREMVRAVMEGVCCNLRIVLDALTAQGPSVDEIRVIGGGARSSVWRQIMADIYQTPILQTEYPHEATSLGAAIAGGVGIDVFDDMADAEELVRTTDQTDPDPWRSRRYERLFEIFDASYRHLTEVFDEISEFQSNDGRAGS